MNKLSRELAVLSLERKFGASRKLTAIGDLPLPVFSYGPRVGQNYFELPVTAILRSALIQAQKTTAYVTGVSVEMDITHATEAEFFGMCLVVPGAVEPLPVYDGMFRMGCGSSELVRAGSGSSDGKREAMVRSDPRIQVITDGVFTEPARDGSLFNAPLSPSGGRYVSVCDSTLNGGRKQKHRGRVACRLTRRAGGTAVSDQFVKDTKKIWFPIKKEMRFLVDPLACTLSQSVAGEYLGLCGLRPDFQVETMGAPSSSSKPGGTFGSIENVRVIVYCRF